MKKKRMVALLMAVMLLGVCTLPDQALAYRLLIDGHLYVSVRDDTYYRWEWDYENTHDEQDPQEQQQSESRNNSGNSQIPQNRQQSGNRDNFWLGGQQGNSDNKSGDGWNYDPATNTLTLDSFSFSGTGKSIKFKNGVTCYSGICYEGDETLNIVLTGENSIEIQDVNKANTEIDAILCRGNLVFSGDGSLSVKAGACGSDSYSIGIMCGKDITFAGGTVTSEGSKAAQSYGIMCDGQIKATGGTLNAVSGEGTDYSTGIWCGKEITFAGGTVNAEGGKAAQSSGVTCDGQIKVTDGILNAISGEGTDYSIGILCGKDIIFAGGTVTSAGGKAAWSLGAYCFNQIKITGGTLNATAATASSGSTGIYSVKDFILQESSVHAASDVVTGDGSSCGIVANSVTVEGGTLSAEGSESANAGSMGIISKNGFSLRGGKVTIVADTAKDNSYGLCVNEGDMAVEGGKLEAKSGSAGNWSVGVMAYSMVKIHGGAVISRGDTSSYSFGLYSGADMIISGGDIEAFGGQGNIYSEGIVGASNLTIEAGVLRAIANTADKGSYGIDIAKEIFIRGGKVSAEGGDCVSMTEIGYSGGIKNHNHESFIISGGTVTASGGKANHESYGLCSLNLQIQGGEVSVFGGKITGQSPEPTAYDYGSFGVEGNITVSGGTTTLSGQTKAVLGKVTTSMSGTGWSDVSGTKGKTAIRAGKEAQELSFLKVKFAPVSFSFK